MSGTASRDEQADGGGPGKGVEWGTTAAVGGLMFLLLRLLAITHYHWGAAFGISDAINFDDVVGVLVGTLLGDALLTGLMLAVIVPLLAAERLHGHRRGRWAPGRTLVVIVLAGVYVSGLVSFRSWPLLLVVLVVTALLIFVLVRRGPAEEAVHRLLARTGLLGMSALLVLGAVSDTPWVPKERITLQGGGQLVGYVMDVTNVTVKVLLDDERELRLVSSKDIASRVELD
ncbi:hypothetical protein [Actinomadura hibisca]|uniref:hypothetical protein n=1 Tax=Actinomadura hibisca TaxID=68565 RepID=UPI000836A94F|nr:hypothetical protein [Actinomadura hibisca]